MKANAPHKPRPGAAVGRVPFRPAALVAMPLAHAVAWGMADPVAAASLRPGEGIVMAGAGRSAAAPGFRQEAS